MLSRACAWPVTYQRQPSTALITHCPLLAWHISFMLISKMHRSNLRPTTPPVTFHSAKSIDEIHRRRIVGKLEKQQIFLFFFFFVFMSMEIYGSWAITRQLWQFLYFSSWLFLWDFVLSFRCKFTSFGQTVVEILSSLCIIVIEWGELFPIGCRLENYFRCRCFIISQKTLKIIFVVIIVAVISRSIVAFWHQRNNQYKLKIWNSNITIDRLYLITKYINIY